MNHRPLAFALLLFALLLSMNVSLAEAEIAANGNEFTLYYSNDVHGETEPCG